MSIKIMSQIFESETLHPTQRLIMLALADHANDQGECYPSISRLCRRTGLTRRAMQSNIRKLQDGGFLDIHLNEGRGGANLYIVAATRAGDAPAQEMRRAYDDAYPRRRCAGGAHITAPTRAGDAPKPSITINEPSITVISSTESQFAEFWGRYPRRVGKANAKKAYDKATKTIDHDDLMFALSQHLPSLTANDPKYIPHASTWLNAERYHDEPEQLANNQNGNRNGGVGSGTANAFAAVAADMLASQRTGR